MQSFHPSIADVLQYFDYRHLPERLRAVSEPFARQAFQLALGVPPGPELTVALRKLLEAKDAAVRASKAGDPQAVCLEIKAALGL